jgi:Uma2 family endonuclease
MSEVLTKYSEVKQPLYLDSEEAFDAWCDEDIRAEYVNGEVIMDSPAGTGHENAIPWLTTLLQLFIDREDLGELYGSNTQIRLVTGKRRLADLTFVARDRLPIVHPTYIDGAPDLVIEFVSEESTERDWREKYWEYEAAGVKEYWIIDQRLKRMELYILAEDNKYVPAEEQDGKLYSKVLPGFWLRPEWFWQKSMPNVLQILREMGFFKL